MSCSLNDLEKQAKRLRLSSLLKHAQELAKNPEMVMLSHADWLKILFDQECLR